jgi:predicted nucleotidyltransferase component of viral defense system
MSKFINKDAAKFGVSPSQIEKDYVISWLLWGISQNDLLSEILIFKGGTCLKKMHFGDYRYSEDMDFTIDPEKQDDVTDQDIIQAFEEIFEELKEATGMQFSIPEDGIRPHAATKSMKFNIAYVGPLGGNGNSVKVDATRGEQLEFPVEDLSVIHEYEDLQEEADFTVQCYGLKEVIIEKMVALMGRTVPRDLYDFEYLTTEEGIEMQDIFQEFQSKAMHKANTDKHYPKHFVKVVSEKEGKFAKAWDSNLRHQMKELSKFDDIWRNVAKQFKAFEQIT